VQEMKRRPKEPVIGGVGQSLGTAAEPLTAGISRQPSVEQSGMHSRFIKVAV